MNLEKIFISFEKANEDYEYSQKSLHWKKLNNQFYKEVKKKGLKNFRKNKLSRGLDDEGKMFFTNEKLLNLIDKCGKKFIDKYSECEIGNPNFYEFNGRKYNMNDLYNINFLYQVQNFMKKPPRYILEIGGGYGSLAAKLKKFYKDSKIILIDLPEANLLQTYYISSCFEKCNIFTYEDFKIKKNNVLQKEDFNNFDFVALPPWCIEKLGLNNSVDLVINTRSMMEMNMKTIKNYFDNIHKFLKSDGIFYNVNKYEKTTSGDIIKISNYPYDDNWEVLSSFPSWSQPNLHEIVTKRSPIKTEQVKNILSRLPKENLHIGKIYFHKILIRKMLDFIFYFIPKKILKKILKIYL